MAVGITRAPAAAKRPTEASKLAHVQHHLWPRAAG
jgi:hypothetical protein